MGSSYCCFHDISPFQVEEVRAEFMAVDYKPHYQRARQLVQLLQAQLAPFKGLTDEINEAQKLQVGKAAWNPSLPDTM